MSEHIISKQDEGIRLDRWFKRHQPGFPHGLLEKSLRKGIIRLDGKKAKTSDRLQAGQALLLPEISYEPAAKIPRKKYVPTREDEQLLKGAVLYEDAYMVALNKPSGLPVQGGSKVKKSVDDMLDVLATGGQRPKLTHRLDRDTSGVLLLGKDAAAATYLTKQFAAKTIEKTYLALVYNTPHPLEGVIKQKLGKILLPDSEKEVMAKDDDGKPAFTHYRVLESLAGKFALVELKPETGRTHQLRVHMQLAGCPIVGDQKYGGHLDLGQGLDIENRLHLHAWKAKFVNQKGKPLEITAPLPPHMLQSFAALEIEM